VAPLQQRSCHGTLTACPSDASRRITGTIHLKISAARPGDFFSSASLSAPRPEQLTEVKKMFNKRNEFDFLSAL
jgi:hypothetical protein